MVFVLDVLRFSNYRFPNSNIIVLEIFVSHMFYLCILFTACNISSPPIPTIMTQHFAHTYRFITPCFYPWDCIPFLSFSRLVTSLFTIFEKTALYLHVAFALVCILSCCKPLPLGLFFVPSPINT